MLTNNWHNQGGDTPRPGFDRRDDLPPSPDENDNNFDPPDTNVNSSERTANANPPGSPNVMKLNTSAKTTKGKKLWSESLGEKRNEKLKAHYANSEEDYDASMLDDNKNSDSSDEDETMLNEGVTTAHKNNSEKGKTEENKKNKKNNTIGDGNMYQALSDENMEFDEEGAREEKLMEKYKFFETLAKTSMREKKFTDNAYHERNQIMNLIGNASKELITTILKETVTTQLTLQFTIENPFNLSEEQIGDAILQAAEDMIEMTTAKIPELDTTINDLKYRKFEMMKEREVQNVSSQSAEEFELGSTCEKYRNERHRLVNNLVSAHSMENLRVIQDKVYFPEVLDPLRLHSCMEKLEIQCYREITPESLKNSIITNLDNLTINSLESPDQYFTLKKHVMGNGRLLYASVNYLPMKGGENAQTYYARNFLSPHDKILHFSLQPIRTQTKSQALNQGKSQVARFEAHVLIELGLEKTPPRKITAGRVRDTFAHDYSHWDDGDEQIEWIKSDLKYLDEHYGTLDNPEIKRVKLERQQALHKYETIKRSQNKTVEYLSKFPAHVYLSDRYDMTSQIIFNLQYCSLCHTTAHSFRDCKERGCNICYNRNHPAYKCKSKCPCKRGRLHAKEQCPHGTQQTTNNGPSLDELRRANHDRNQIFFKQLEEKERQKKLSANNDPASQDNAKAQSVSQTNTSSGVKPPQAITSALSESAQGGSGSKDPITVPFNPTPSQGAESVMNTHPPTKVLKKLSTADHPDTPMSSIGSEVLRDLFLPKLKQKIAATEIDMDTEVDEPQISSNQNTLAPGFSESSLHNSTASTQYSAFREPNAQGSPGSQPPEMPNDGLGDLASTQY